MLLLLNDYRAPIYSLISYSVSNYKSIGLAEEKDDYALTISFEPSAEKISKKNEALRLLDNLFTPSENPLEPTEKRIKNNEKADSNSQKLLKGVFIFGDNGAGKSNIIESLQFLRDFTMGRPSRHFDRFDNQEDAKAHLHKLYEDSCAEHKVSFYLDAIRYDYTISYDKGLRIKHESLYYSPKGRTTMLFERNEDSDSIKLGKSYEHALQNCKIALKPNSPLLGVAARFTDIVPIKNALNFFRKGLVSISLSRFPRMVDEEIGKYCEDTKRKERVIHCLRRMGIDIADIYSEMIYQTYSRRIDYDSQDEAISSRTEERRRVMIRYVLPSDSNEKTKAFTIPLKDESSGIQKLIAILFPLIEAVDENKIILLDEIENSIHDNAMRELIRYCFEESKEAQILAVTHATCLLDAMPSQKDRIDENAPSIPLLRRDQVYFAWKNQNNRTTKVKALCEIKDYYLRASDTKIRDKYLLGVLLEKQMLTDK